MYVVSLRVGSADPDPDQRIGSRSTELDPDQLNWIHNTANFNPNCSDFNTRPTEEEKMELYTVYSILYTPEKIRSFL